MAGSAVKNCTPLLILRRLFSRAKDQDAVGRNQAANLSQQHAASFMREVKQNISEQNYIESLTKWK